MDKRFLRIRIHGLTLILAFIVFTVISLTMVTTGFLLVLLSKMDIIYKFPTPSRGMGIIFIAILSVIIATVLTLIFGHIPLKPINDVIEATKELSKGNFEARINFSKIPELRELSDSFNKMAEELGSTELLRNDFINNFSHEFKTPIVSLKGFAKLLKNDNLSKEERDEYLDIIVSESRRLSTLATNVLNISRIENQKIVGEMKTFDLSESIRRCILMLEGQWRGKGIELDINLDEVMFDGNEELLNQVWINLIDNAIKFSENGGKIEISLSRVLDRVCFKVRDYGCGMSEEEIPRIFEKFYQGDTSHGIYGNGLGLPLVKRILDLVNGEIKVTSVLGKGSVVSTVLK
ncbi:MAG: HAMP domain-containing sensor histidine kinase [Clostridium sp.]